MTKKPISNRKKNNWYVITGGPSSGKTTTVNLLEERGYFTIEENGRHFLETQRLKGRTVEEVMENHKEFQLEILQMQIDREKGIAPGELVFLDRAIPDALAYYRFLNLEVDEKLAEALSNVSYKKIFIMDPLPLVNDYVRLENPEAQLKLHKLIIEVYEALPFPVIYVPVLPIDERADFILNNL